MIIKGKINQLLVKPTQYNAGKEVVRERYAVIDLSLHMETDDEIESIKKNSDLIRSERVRLAIVPFGTLEFGHSITGEFGQMTIEPAKYNRNGEKTVSQHALVNINLDLDTPHQIDMVFKVFNVINCEMAIIRV